MNTRLHTHTVSAAPLKHKLSSNHGLITVINDYDIPIKRFPPSKLSRMNIQEEKDIFVNMTSRWELRLHAVHSAGGVPNLTESLQ